MHKKMRAAEGEFGRPNRGVILSTILCLSLPRVPNAFGRARGSRPRANWPLEQCPGPVARSVPGPGPVAGLSPPERTAAPQTRDIQSKDVVRWIPIFSPTCRLLSLRTAPGFVARSLPCLV